MKGELHHQIDVLWCCILSIFHCLNMQNLTKFTKFMCNLTKFTKFMCFSKFDPLPIRHKLACKILQETFNFNFRSVWYHSMVVLKV